MASQRAVEQDREGDRVKVLVTGYGPYSKDYPVNPSWSLCSRLPSHLELSQNNDSSKTTIRIKKYKHPIRVAYFTVTDLVPNLCSGRYSRHHNSADTKPDIIVHLGHAPKRGYWTLETQAPRRPYDRHKDIDGHVFTENEGKVLFADAPDTLKPTFDMIDVFNRWKEHLSIAPRHDSHTAPRQSTGHATTNTTSTASEDVDTEIARLRLRNATPPVPEAISPKTSIDEAVQPQPVEADPNGPQYKAICKMSQDPGNFLCGFIFYTSLSWYWNSKSEERPVVFLHVPDCETEEELELGGEVVRALIQAIVENWIEQKRRRSEQDGDQQGLAGTQVTPSGLAAREAHTQTQGHLDQPKAINPMDIDDHADGAKVPHSHNE